MCRSSCDPLGNQVFCTRERAHSAFHLERFAAEALIRPSCPKMCAVHNNLDHPVRGYKVFSLSYGQKGELQDGSSIYSIPCETSCQKVVLKVCLSVCYYGAQVIITPPCLREILSYPRDVTYVFTSRNKAQISSYRFSEFPYGGVKVGSGSLSYRPFKRQADAVRSNSTPKSSSEKTVTADQPFCA
jgi:hypothetical protein